MSRQHLPDANFETDIETGTEIVTATCGGTIIWYDGPVLFWASTGRRDFLVMALGEPDDAERADLLAAGCEAAPDYLALELDDPTRRRYVDNASDLRSLLLEESASLFILSHADFSGSECRLTRYRGPLVEFMLPAEDCLWSSE